MLDDEQIRERGGTDEDIADYAHDVGGACMYPSHDCEICKTRLGENYKLSDDVEVAPGIFQSRKDYEANMAFDEARDNAL